MILEKKEEIFKHNYNFIKVLFRVAFSLGVNLTARSKIKDALKVLHVILTLISFKCLYAQWCYLMRNINSMPLIGESVYTALQLLMTATNMIYFGFTHHTFNRVLDQTLAHEIIRKIEIFQHNFPKNQELKREIDAIMNGVWRNTRRYFSFSLSFIFYCCLGIICNFFFSSFFVNLYHQLKQTPDYKFVLPEFLFLFGVTYLVYEYIHFLIHQVFILALPALHTFWEEKGLTFFYYQMFMTTAAIRVSGMCAVCIDGVFIVLCKHAVGLVQIHNLLVRHANTPQIPAERRVEYLRYVIMTYQRINKYMLEIQTNFRHISLSQFLLSLISFGFILFEVNYGLDNVHFGSTNSNHYILLSWQALTNVNEEIPIVYYNCNWYEENKTFKGLIMMMIMRSNQDFYLEVAWFTLMNLATMIDLFRASGSYCLLLEHFQEG